MILTNTVIILIGIAHYISERNFKRDLKKNLFKVVNKWIVSVSEDEIIAYRKSIINKNK